MASRPQFTSQSRFNKLFLVQSLDENENTGIRLALDTIHPLASRQGFGLTAATVREKADLSALFDSILEQCRTHSIYPILHAEIHGADDKTGLVLKPSNEFIPWTDFIDLCRPINEACSNNLLVVMGVCYGYNAILSVDIKRSTPFYALIGPERTVPTGFLIDNFPKFYEELLLTFDLHAAMRHLLSEYQMFLCERLFFKTFLRYSRELCNGLGKEKRIDELIELLQTNLGGTLLNEADVRAELHEAINPSKESFDKFHRRFLMSDYPKNLGRFKVGFDELMAIL